jgi:endonuclease/exonuclease/phosphatase family metal-dependent hydrolase
MPEITGPLPTEATDQLRVLTSALDAVIPPKRLDDNLLIATWNLRAFGDVTEKWRSEKGDSPQRDLLSVLCIAKIASRFDVIAVQEVKDNIKGLRDMMKVLGPEWGFLLTDTNRGDPGNDERMAFVYDSRRVKPSGLACELVILPAKNPEFLEGQFARPPYAASFISAGQTFILTTLHILFGKKPADRVDELAEIAKWMADWARREQSWGHNLICLGDFNIDRAGDPNYEAFTSSGLTPPSELEALPRTIFASKDDANFFDQIAWFKRESGVPYLTLNYTGIAGNFDFVDSVMTDLDRNSLSWHISDHYPLWAEFSVRPTT